MCRNCRITTSAQTALFQTPSLTNKGASALFPRRAPWLFLYAADYSAGTGLRWKRLLSLSDDRFERRFFVHGKISHDFTVKLDPGQFHAVHEL